jgi:hypothetical protein
MITANIKQQALTADFRHTVESIDKITYFVSEARLSPDAMALFSSLQIHNHHHQGK